MASFGRGKILDGVTMATDQMSPVVNLDGVDLMSAQVVLTTADAVGDIYLQASNDNTNWVNLYFSLDGVGGSSVPVASANRNDLIELTPAFKFFRAFWDRTSGTGTLSIIEFHKRRGGR